MVDRKKDKVKFDVIPKINEEYISLTHGCVKFNDSYRFLPSSCLDSLVKTLVDKSYRTLKILKKEFVDIDEILKTVIEIREGEDRTFEDLKKDFPEEIEKLEESLVNYIGEIDHKIL